MKEKFLPPPPPFYVHNLLWYKQLRYKIFTRALLKKHLFPMKCEDLNAAAFSVLEKYAPVLTAAARSKNGVSGRKALQYVQRFQKKRIFPAIYRRYLPKLKANNEDSVKLIDLFGESLLKFIFILPNIGFSFSQKRKIAKGGCII